MEPLGLGSNPYEITNKNLSGFQNIDILGNLESCYHSLEQYCIILLFNSTILVIYSLSVITMTKIIRFGDQESLSVTHHSQQQIVLQHAIKIGESHF